MNNSEALKKLIKYYIDIHTSELSEKELLSFFNVGRLIISECEIEMNNRKNKQP